MLNSSLSIPFALHQIRKGLDLTFKKLITLKKAQNGILVLSEKGEIKKIKAADIIS